MENFSFTLVLRYALSVSLLVALVVISVVGIRWFRSMGTEGATGIGYVRLIREVVENFVLAAEQYYKSGEGAQKKEWVLDQLEAWCKRRGIPFDRALVSALVEAAVYAAINGPKGTKTEEVKTIVAVANAGGDPHALPFVKGGEAPVLAGPPPVETK